ncbi:hypothetical protein Droror1_Dr00016573 [Drosera rotundifolia]
MEEDNKKKVAIDKKTMNILFQTLDEDLFEHVVHCTFAEVVWDSFVVKNEGMNDIRKSRLPILVQKYELFTQKSSERLTDIFERFNILLNSLKTYGNVYNKKDPNLKFIWVLSDSWNSKSSTVKEAKDLSVMTLKDLDALKASQSQPMTRNDDESDELDEEDEIVSFISKRLVRFGRK